jgi:hypothetical protein|tara:strand:- start:186 stop:434 length:249 start_codon:yes stop_codon:yes gene_type:complete
MKNKIEISTEAFIDGKPQLVILNIPQLEKLARLEIGAAVLLEDIQNFNDEIGNNHEPNFSSLKVTSSKAYKKNASSKVKETT